MKLLGEMLAVVVVAALLALLLAVVGCGPKAGGPAPAPPPAPLSPLPGPDPTPVPTPPVRPQPVPTPSPIPPPAPKPRLTIIVFTTPTCPYCIRMRAVIADPAVQARLAHFDVRQANHSDYVRYGVRAVPTAVVTRPDGSEVARREGYMDVNAVCAFLDSLEAP